jgi:hypothetical protein
MLVLCLIVAICLMVVIYQFGTLVVSLRAARKQRISDQLGGVKHALAAVYQGEKNVWQRSVLEAILVGLWPGRFDPLKARRRENVIVLLKRAGYPYDTLAQFYAVAARDFITWVTVGAIVSALMVMVGMPYLVPLEALIFGWLGLNRPYARLRAMAKRRASLVSQNMLVALSVFEALLAGGLQVQESIKTVANLGGPFCNLLLLLGSKMAESGGTIESAIKEALEHLPDPSHIEARLFFQDLRDSYDQYKQRKLSASIPPLRRAVHRDVVDTTSARAAQVRQSSTILGVFALVGMILTMILPYIGSMGFGL